MYASDLGSKYFYLNPIDRHTGQRFDPRRTCSSGIAPASNAEKSWLTAAGLRSQPLRSSCRSIGQAPRRTASFIAAQPASPMAPANSESFSRVLALASASNASAVKGTVFSAAPVQTSGLLA